MTRTMETRFVVRIENVPVRFEDRIAAVASDAEATRFVSREEAVLKVARARRSMRGVSIVEVPA